MEEACIEEVGRLAAGFEGEGAEFEGLDRETGLDEGGFVVGKVGGGRHFEGVVWASYVSSCEH